MMYTFSFDPSARYMYFCAASFENAMSHAEPSPGVFFAMKTSFTNVPSGLKTWMRSFTRSQT